MNTRFQRTPTAAAAAKDKIMKSFLNNLFAKKNARRKSFQPRLESLEDRQLLSAFGSLYNTVQLAPVSSTISVVQAPAVVAAPATGQTVGDLPSTPSIDLANTEVLPPPEIHNAGDTTGDGDLIPQSGHVTKDDPGYIAINAKYLEFGELGAHNAFGDPLPGNAGMVHVTDYAQGAQNTAEALGRGIEFTNGSIYWSRATGAHAIFADIRAKWLEMGGTAYGYPTNDNLYYDVGRNGVLLQDFMRSDGDYRSIVFWQRVNPDALAYDDWFKHGIGTDPGIPYYFNVTHAVYGDIRDKWMDLGGVKLGVPLGDEHDFHVDAAGFFPGWSGQFQDFLDLASVKVFEIFCDEERGNGVNVYLVTKDDLPDDEAKLLGGMSSFVGDSGNVGAATLNSSIISFAATDALGNAHVLEIQNQSIQADGSTAITGLWNGQSGAGMLSRDETGNVHITFDTGLQSLDGTISASAGGAYHLDAAATVPGGDPVQIAGDDSGTPHEVQIQTQTAPQDGTAIFSADGDGNQVVTDTLPPTDAAGNMPFSISTGSISFAVADAGNVDSLVHEQASTSEYLSYLDGELDTPVVDSLPSVDANSSDQQLADNLDALPDQTQPSAVDALASLNQVDGSGIVFGNPDDLNRDQVM